MRLSVFTLFTETEADARYVGLIKTLSLTTLFRAAMVAVTTLTTFNACVIHATPEKQGLSTRKG